MKLEFTEHTLRVVSSSDLDNTVTQFLREKELLGPNAYYEIEAEEELQPDSKPTYSVVTGVKLDKVVLNCTKWNLHAILDWMCAEGWVEPGEYMVENRT